MLCNGVLVWLIRINLYGLKEVICCMILLLIELVVFVIIICLFFRWEVILWMFILIGLCCKRFLICIFFNWVLFSVCLFYLFKGGVVSNFMLLESRVLIIFDFFSFFILVGEIMMVCILWLFMFLINVLLFGKIFVFIIILLISLGLLVMKLWRW